MIKLSRDLVIVIQLHGLGKMSSSETTRSPLVAKDDEIPQNLGDGDVVHEQEESLEQNSTEENVSVI